DLLEGGGRGADEGAGALKGLNHRREVGHGGADDRGLAEADGLDGVGAALAPGPSEGAADDGDVGGGVGLAELAAGGKEEAGEVGGAGDVVLDAGGVPLHGAGDVAAAGGDAHGDESLGIGGVLHGGEVERGEDGAEEAAEAPVALEGVGAEAPVDDADGD